MAYKRYREAFLVRCVKLTKAWFKRRILHAPNRIAKLNACKMRRLNQLNASQSNIRLKLGS